MTIRRPGASPMAGRPRPAVPRRPLSDSFEFAAALDAVPLARRHARVCLREWGLAELSGDAESVVTELAENAVQATSRARLLAPVRLTLFAGLRTVLITVRDAVPDPPVPRQPAGLDDLASWNGGGSRGSGGSWGDDDSWDGDDDSDPDTHGRGLLIVAALSARWDWKPCPGGGKIVRSLIRGQRQP